MANIAVPAASKRTLGFQNDRYSQHIGPTTDFEPSLINLSNFDPEDETYISRGTLRKVGDADTFLLLPDSGTQGYEHTRQDSDAIEQLVRPHGPVLVNLFFSVIHPSFPILQKPILLEKYASSYHAVSPACLAVIYILAINWWDQSPQLVGLPKPDLKELERLARVTLADAMFRPKLSTIQAGLLLSQRPEGDQWAPTGQLLAIAQELGLHLDCTEWKIPPWERGVRKRLAWAMYMQDKWGALIHGRPSHIFASNWAVRPLSTYDFAPLAYESDTAEEAAEIEQGRHVFIQMVSLSRILAEILDTFYTLQAMSSIAAAGPRGPQILWQQAKPVQLKLKNWFAALPSTCRMESSSASTATLAAMSASKLSPVGSLHLHYYAVEITLHRRLIRAFSQVSLPKPSAPLTRSQSEITIGSSLAAGTGMDPYAVQMCRNAAKTRLISAMDFVNRLHTAHLRSFWYFASKTNFALIGTFGSLLWATAPGKEEAEWYARRLGEYRWTLGVNSKRSGVSDPGTQDASVAIQTKNGLTAFAMTMLDISTGLLSRLPEKPLLSDSDAHHSTTSETRDKAPVKLDGVGAARARTDEIMREQGLGGFANEEEEEEEGYLDLDDDDDGGVDGDVDVDVDVDDDADGDSTVSEMRRQRPYSRQQVR